MAGNVQGGLNKLAEGDGGIASFAKYLGGQA